MHTTFDVVVLGLGANGSSAIYHLSKTGCKVLGIDRFTPPHNHGSSHGQSRIIRQAYHENPMYVPLVKEAYNLWYEMEENTGEKLLLKTGGIMLGSENSEMIRGANLSAKTHDVSYEYLDSHSVKKRFPALKPLNDTVAVLDKEAGLLFPEKCIKTYLNEAEKNGAFLHYNEKVVRIISNENDIEIITDKDNYRTAKLIVSAGSWLGSLMPELHLPLTVERQVLYWLKNKNHLTQQYFAPGNLPVYMWEYLPGKIFYGFPDLGDGIKIAFHHSGEPIAPDTLTSAVSVQEISSITEVAEKYVNINAVFNYSVTCMYTNTPDENFIIDFHPYNKNIIIASPCSGHGFKFCSLTGKILCDMTVEKPVFFDISPFSISRFG